MFRASVKVLFSSERQEGDKEGFSTPWVTPQMLATARAGAGWSQEPGTPSRCPRWMAGAQLLEPQPAAPTVRVSSQWESDSGCGCPQRYPSHHTKCLSLFPWGNIFFWSGNFYGPHYRLSCLPCILCSVSDSSHLSVPRTDSQSQGVPWSSSSVEHQVWESLGPRRRVLSSKNLYSLLGKRKQTSF